MAKPTKPAQKGGAKKCAPKKAAKKPAKKLTERQADQLAADTMRAQALAAATKRLERAEAATSSPVHFVHARPKPTLWSSFRSAITWLFVSKKYAEANPDTTVRERVKP